jgi:hypothetical protein
MTRLHLSDFERGALGDDVTAGRSAFGTEVDDVVYRFYNIEIVFDHEDSVAFVYQLVQYSEKFFDILKMKAGSRFIQDIKSLTSGAAGKLGSELDALGFTTRERGSGLAEADIAEADFAQGLELGAYVRDKLEKTASFFDGHAEYIGDTLVFVVDFQCFFAVTSAMADFAFDIDIGQELHFDFH